MFLPLLTMAGIHVTISDGIENTSVKTKMETKMSALLTEINAAQASNRSINFANLNLDNSIQTSLSMLWENSPFMCTDAEIVERCLTMGTGYQIRNIPLIMKPRSTEKFNESEYQEGVFSFDKQGNLESFYLSISNNIYMNVLKDGRDITDLRRRQLILDYVERFRTSYNTKDIQFLEQIFSDDALIITGRVISQKKDNISLPDKVVYKKQTKQEYLTNLRAVFARNNYIRVTFDDVKIMQSRNNANFYGVTVRQGYTSDSYHDDGYVFMLWNFTDEEHPQIHVRTWQPSEIRKGKPLPEDEIFNLNDFPVINE